MVKCLFSGWQAICRPLFFSDFFFFLSRASTSTRAVQAVEKGWYNVGIDTCLKIAESLNLSIKVGE